MLRILYISHSFPRPGEPLSNIGGMQRVATGLRDALTCHPDVDLSVRGLETRWKETPYRMVPFMAGLLRDVPRTVRRNRIDVVLFSSMVTATLAVPLRRRIARYGARTAAIPVGRDVTLPTPPYQWFLPRVFGALDHVFPISHATGEECLRRGLAPGKMEVVPCGADPEQFFPAPDRPAARRSMVHDLIGTDASLPEDALLLCSIGRLQERKGFHWFIDQVMPRLPANVHYVLGGLGPMEGVIRQAVSRRGLEPRVHLLGRLSEEDLCAAYRGTDLFLMPNLYVPGDIEGFGVVILEAGLCGAPVIAANLEGVRDVISERNNGHLVGSGDADAFARAILKYDGDPAAIVAASRRTVAHTRRIFSWRAITDRYVASLRSSLETRGVRSRDAA